MKKALTPILAVVAVIAIVFACVFGTQNGSNKSKLDETTAALNAAKDSVKTLEDEKAKLSADLEAAKADLEAKASELETKVSELTAKSGEFDTAKADLEAKVAELEQKLTKTERALTAAKSNAYIMFASADWSDSNWGTADSDDDIVKVTPAAVSGPGANRGE